MAFPTSMQSSGFWVINGGSTFNLYGIDNTSLNPSVKTVTQAAGGQPSPSFITTMNLEPMITGSCNDVKTALTNGISFSGLAISSSNTLDVFYSAFADAALRGGAGTNFQCTVNKGLICPKTLSVDQNGIAKVDLEVYVSWDGTNEPFAFTDSVNLPSTAVISTLHTLGPMYISGSQLVGVNSFSLDFGLSVEPVFSDGDKYPRFLKMSKKEPKITIKALGMGPINTFGISGTAQGATASHFYLRALANRSDRIADNVASHIKFTIPANQAMIVVNSAGGNNQDSAECEIVITPIDGSSAMLAVSAASTITT